MDQGVIRMFSYRRTPRPDTDVRVWTHTYLCSIYTHETGKNLPLVFCTRSCVHMRPLKEK